MNDDLFIGLTALIQYLPFSRSRPFSSLQSLLPIHSHFCHSFLSLLIMSLPSSLLLLSSVFFLFKVVEGCMPTEPSVTTTTPKFICCPILTSSSLLKTPPVLTKTGALLEQCSILRRISSQCGDEAYLTCESAPYTNPTQVFIQVFDVNGNKIDDVPGTKQYASAILTCNHLTGVYTFQGTPVSRVSCAQDGSMGENGPDSIFN